MIDPVSKWALASGRVETHAKFSLRLLFRGLITIPRVFHSVSYRVAFCFESFARRRRSRPSRGEQRSHLVGSGDISPRRRFRSFPVGSDITVSDPVLTGTGVRTHQGEL